MNSRLQLGRDTGAALALIVAIALAASPLPVVATESSSGAGAAAAKVPASPWRDAGRLVNGRFGNPLVATSQSGVFAAVAVKNDGSDNDLRPVRLVRRMPDGTTDRATIRLSRVEGIDVDPCGTVLVLGSRHKTVVAATWQRRARSPRTRTVFDGHSFPGVGIEVRLLTNNRGDAAALFVDRQKNAYIVRRNAGSTTWRKPIRVAPDDYDAQLADAELAPGGSIAGAFLRDHVVELRTLAPGARTFGAGVPAVGWPEIDDVLDFYYERVDLTIGPAGDSVVALSYRWSYEDEEDGWRTYYNGRFAILGDGHAPYQGQFVESTHDVLDRPVVGIDGSVGLEWTQLVRWDPVSESFDAVGFGTRLAASPRGDLLYLADDDPPLSIWSLGAKPFETSMPPRGQATAWLMTNQHRAYVVTKRRGAHPGSYLTIGRLHRS